MKRTTALTKKNNVLPLNLKELREILNFNRKVKRGFKKLCLSLKYKKFKRKLVNMKQLIKQGFCHYKDLLIHW